MSEEDMADFLQKINNMMNSSNSLNQNVISSSESDNNFENIQDFLSKMNFESDKTNSNDYDKNTFNFNDNNFNNNNKNNFNLDFNTILKIKNIMDKFSSYKNSPDTNLLLSLKPYLNSNRKKKLDQYMQFLNIAKLLENFNSNGDVNIKW